MQIYSRHVQTPALQRTLQQLSSLTQLISQSMRHRPRSVVAACITLLLCLLARHASGQTTAANQQQLSHANSNACLREAFSAGLKDRSV